MTQAEFYNLPLVKSFINVQKRHPHGSFEHRTAHKNIVMLARQHGVYEQFRKAGGCDY